MESEVPEADAVEQHQDVVDEEPVADPPTIDIEVPEADAYEQSQSVPVDDDDMRD